MRQREIQKKIVKVTCEQVLSLGFKSTLSDSRVYALNEFRTIFKGTVCQSQESTVQVSIQL